MEKFNFNLATWNEDDDLYFINISEMKKVGEYLVVKGSHPVWLDYGSRLDSSFSKLWVFIPKKKKKEMEISKYLGQEETRKFLGNESYEDTPNAAFGGHIMRNVKSWNEVGLEWDHPFEDSLNTLREIKSYLKKNPCGCGIYG